MEKIRMGISIPKELVHKIEDRREVVRSRYISKILTWSYNDAIIDSLEVGFVGLVSSESVR